MSSVIQWFIANHWVWLASREYCQPNLSNKFMVSCAHWLNNFSDCIPMSRISSCHHVKPSWQDFMAPSHWLTAQLSPDLALLCPHWSLRSWMPGHHAFSMHFMSLSLPSTWQLLEWKSANVQGYNVIVDCPSLVIHLLLYSRDWEAWLPRMLM